MQLKKSARSVEIKETSTNGKTELWNGLKEFRIRSIERFLKERTIPRIILFILQGLLQWWMLDIGILLLNSYF